MFIRRARTRNKATGEAYFTHRPVASQRAGKQVRQVILLNFGRHFDLPQPDWPRLCARIEALLGAQPGLLAEAKPIETLAQRCAARLMTDRPAARAGSRPDPSCSHGPNVATPSTAADFAEPAFRWHQPSWRSVGVEAVGLAAIGWIGLTLDPLIAAQACKTSASMAFSARPWPPA
ncbi:MAG: hypothetical protein ABSC06_35705 [Rhodopila sp.]